jgi:hypothetical protein
MFMRLSTSSHAFHARHYCIPVLWGCVDFDVENCTWGHAHHFTFESKISSPLEMGTLVVCPTTWEPFRGISRVRALTGMLVIVMSLSVIFLPAPKSVAATTTSIRSSVLSRTQAVEANASTNVRTVRDHFIAGSFFMA